MLKVLEKAEIKLKKKKNRNHSLKQIVKEKNLENLKLRQIIQLYHNQNANGLKKLSVSTLDKIERDLVRFLDSLKSQKALKVFNKKLSLLHNNMESSLISSFLETARNLAENELNNPFLSKKEEIFDEIKFEEDFFNLDDSDGVGKKNKVLLNSALKKQLNAFDDSQASHREENVFAVAKMDIEKKSPHAIKISLGKSALSGQLEGSTPKRQLFKCLGLHSNEPSGTKNQGVQESWEKTCNLVNEGENYLNNMSNGTFEESNVIQPLRHPGSLRELLNEANNSYPAAQNLTEQMRFATTHEDWSDRNDENTSTGDYCLKSFREQGFRNL